MKQFLAILILCLNYASYSQTEFQKNQLAIKFIPLNALELYNCSYLNFGVEYIATNKLGLNTEIGFYFPRPKSGYYDTKGLIFKEEVKFYNSDKKPLNQYFSVALAYSKHSYYRIDDITNELGNTENVKYSTIRKFAEFDFNIGILKLIKNRLVLEAFTGVGVRFNHINTSLSEFQANNRQLGDWNNPHNWIEKEGFNVFPKLNLGVKIGFKLF